LPALAARLLASGRLGARPGLLAAVVPRFQLLTMPLARYIECTERAWHALRKQQTELANNNWKEGQQKWRAAGQLGLFDQEEQP
jgi:hypothetical protein